MSVIKHFNLLIEHHLEFISLKGGYTGSSESTLVKMRHCWKSLVTAHNDFFPQTFLNINQFLVWREKFICVLIIGEIICTIVSNNTRVCN